MRILSKHYNCCQGARPRGYAGSVALTSVCQQFAYAEELAGIELMNMIRNGQKIVRKGDELSFDDQFTHWRPNCVQGLCGHQKITNNSAIHDQRDRTQQTGPARCHLAKSLNLRPVTDSSRLWPNFRHRELHATAHPRFLGQLFLGD